MKKLINNKNIKIDENRLQDLVFLIGIFLFFSVLIIGLYPDSGTAPLKWTRVFIYTAMAVPVFAAIYFIVLSFRRNFYVERISFSSSIRTKLAMALIFVAVIPTLVIVLASNNFINRTMSLLLSDKTSTALNRSVDQSKKRIQDFSSNFGREIENMRLLVERGIVNPAVKSDLVGATEGLNIKNIKMHIFRTERNKQSNGLLPVYSPEDRYISKLIPFVSGITGPGSGRIHRLSISNTDLLIGAAFHDKFLLLFTTVLPETFYADYSFYMNSLDEFNQHKDLREFFKSGSGLFLLILTMIILLISIVVSLILSKGITRPVLELVDSTKKLSGGDFSIRLYRKSEDEMGLLYKAFNRMVRELHENSEMMYQKQKLEAWREMAKKVVHEIKNPLTPIRLSAERMRKRFIEKHTDIEEIIVTGTDTIIEEVNTLMAILSEFTRFARLPEMKPEENDINQLVNSCINLFSGHENINFQLMLDKRISAVKFDRILIKQVINNLLQNSVDAIAESGKITVETRLVEINDKDYARINFIDDGIGMSEEEIENIFKPGYSKKKKGTGLGLAIVEMIIIEHNGYLKCTSVPGEGTEFYIDLPVGT
jgi:two-component system, NtrC family, nitrogen regulation sensor histidine kinase NtrY